MIAAIYVTAEGHAAEPLRLLVGQLILGGCDVYQRC